MRVLITGIGSVWGSRVARALEDLGSTEAIIGVDTEEPKVELDTTEFVRADEELSIVPRIARATQVDTILALHLATDTLHVSKQALHDRNVIGTTNVVAAASNDMVRKLVVKGSTHLYGSSYDDPYWFYEQTARKHPPTDPLERSLIEADDIVRELGDENRRVQVTRLRFVDVLSGELESPFGRLLQLPIVPEVLGFDPRIQLVHEVDAVAAVLHATLNQIPGVFNVAGDGVLPWSEVCAIVGKRRAPLPPLMTGWAAAALRRLGAPLPDELLRVIRYGRAVDASAFRAAGYRFTHTTASTVDDFAEWVRLHAAVGDTEPEYTYDHDTESFLRRSPSVVRD
ncbi:MAG: NAD-dependent epimerase/dehydratase family protein [Actinobacteria bacterium]|nr:NAD-dependent epimerase/dehydratase family protein [Actinomycetota bacterium]